MATIEKSGHVWRIREYTDGKLKTVSTADTKIEAQAIRTQLESSRRVRRKISHGHSQTLSALIDKWEMSKVSDGNDPMHTARAAVRLRRLCLDKGWSMPSSVTPGSVSEYRSAGGCARTCGYLAALLRWSADVHDQYVDPRTLIRLRPGKTPRKPRPDLMTPEQVAQCEDLAAGMSPSAGALVHCLSTYGWRPITAARLTVGDLDLVNGLITTSVKGGDIVRHPLLPGTIARLAPLVAGRDPSDILFIDPRSRRPWDPLRGISLWARNHLRIKIYNLKRFAISTLLERGLAPHQIAHFTGHRTIGQVLTYARTNEQAARAALVHFGTFLENDQRVATNHAVAAVADDEIRQALTFSDA